MFLYEQTSVPGASLPVVAFRAHLQLGTGFADDAAQDSVLENYLRAAMAAVEARTGKVLVARDFTWTLTGWREAARQALPLAPVQTIAALRLVDRTGQAQTANPALYRLVPDDHRPALCGDPYLPAIPVAGTAEVDFTAGFGATWSAVPADLAQAVFLLAAHYYEHRSAAGGEPDLPLGVAALVERYRSLRILGGGMR